MRLAVLLVLSAAIALVLAGTSAAATFRIGITGNSVQTVKDDPGPSSDQVSASVDPAGTSPSGSIVAQTYLSSDPNSLTTFHGDVSLGGCVLFQGNQAEVMGKLPDSEQFTFVDGGGNTHLIKWVAVVVQDNGASGDLAGVGLLSLNESTGSDLGARLCAGTAAFSSLTGFLVPADSGNYSFTYSDSLDAYPSQIDTNVALVDSAGLAVTITDATDPGGVDVTVGAGSAQAQFSLCGVPTNVDAGSEVVLTCSSAIVQVIHGSATVVLGGGETTVSVPAGGKVEVSGDTSTGFTVQNQGSTPVTVTVEGTPTTVAAGQTASGFAVGRTFQGFFRPVAALPGVNKVKAGSTVPFKWRLLQASGAPVTHLAQATLTVTVGDCAGSSFAPLQSTTIHGGLQNLGDGYYQLNWKTLASYAGMCATTHLAIGDPTSHDAAFSFTN